MKGEKIMRILVKVSQFVGNTFVVWVLLFSILSFLYPQGFTWIGPYIVPLLGIVMFGMGLTLSANDFQEVFKRPKDVAIGVISQYVIMPLLGYALATLLPVSPEIAIGVILVGCCPGGTASNVMTYLAKGDTALSVAVSSVSTVIAPVVTPALILLFANKWLTVSAGELFWSIVKIIVIPIILGLFVKRIFKSKVDACVQALPLVSVIAIVAIVAAVVGLNKEAIAKSGWAIFSIVFLHNILGLLLGYWLAKLFKMDESKQRAISIEVGMQNSGLAAALATAHFSPIAAVPSAIFSVWHNISGPLVATYFRKKSEKEEQLQISSTKVTT
jgi:bile acid:Na+ symporter, BASS family